MSSIGSTAGAGFRVRWREDSKQLSRSFDTYNQAREFQAYVDSAPVGVPTVRTVYRAYVDAVPLGMYETRAAARAHCLADAEQHGDDVTGAVWEPEDPQDPDGEERLWLPDMPSVSLYSVLPIGLLSDYKPGRPA